MPEWAKPPMKGASSHTISRRASFNDFVPLMLRDAFKKKIVKFGDFVLKGGRGSFQKPNFYIPLNWDF